MAGKTADDLVTAVYDFYISQGYTPLGAAYMVGSLLQESNLNPEKVQPGGPGKGVGQWTDDPDHASYKEMVKYNAAYGRGPNDLTGQLHFSVQWRTDVTKKFKLADTEEKAQAAATDFERFDATKAGDRWKFAQDIIKNVEAKRLPGTGMGKNVETQPGHTPDDLITDLKGKFTKKETGAAGSQCAAGKAKPAAAPPKPRVEQSVKAVLYKPPAGP